jgi:hypothetical protein
MTAAAANSELRVAKQCGAAVNARCPALPRKPTQTNGF